MTILTRRVRASLRRLDDGRRRVHALCKPRPWRTLTDLAAIHGSDKGVTTGERHGYTVDYERLFRPFRRHPNLKILEIGLRFDAYYARLSRVGPSLAMWCDYFPQAQVYGFDIHDFSGMATERVHIFQGDQGDPAQLAQIGTPRDLFDIVIDDGSHASYHQRVTLSTLLPRVAPGGVYLVEDLHYQPPELERALPDTPPMRVLLRDTAFLRTLGVGAPDVEFLAGGKVAVLHKPSVPTTSA